MQKISLSHFSIYTIVFKRIGLGKQCIPRPDCSLEQSDQCLHCLLFHLHILEAFLFCKAMSSNLNHVMWQPALCIC